MVIKKAKKVSKWSWYAVVGCTLLLAVAITLGRHFTPMLKEYRQDLELWLEQNTGQDVELGDLSASWHGMGPAISLTELRLSQSGRTTVELDNVTIKLSLLNLLRQTILPRQIYVHGGEVQLQQQPSGHLLLANTKAGTGGASVAWLPQALLNSLRYAQVDDFDLVLTTAARKKITYHNLAAKFSNNHDESHMQLSYQHPGAIAHTLQFTLSSAGDWQDWSTVASRAYLDVNNFPYTLLAPWLEPQHLPIKNGQISGKAWVDGVGADATAAHLQLELATVMLSNNHLPKQKIRLTGNFAWKQNEPQQWRLQGDHLAIAIGQDQLLPRQFSLSKQREDDSTIWHLRSEALQLKGLSALLLRVAKPYVPLPQGLEKAEPQGELTNVDWQIVQGDNGHNDHHFLADVESFGSKPVMGIPGFNGVSGRLGVFPQAGQFKLNANQLQLHEPKVFTEPLNFSLAEGTINWVHGTAGWLVNGDNLKLINPDLGLSASLSLELDEDLKHPWIELLAEQTKAIEASKVHSYLPWQVFDPKLTAWLRQAIQGGQFQNGVFLWRGPVEKTPFDEGDGTIKAEIDWDDARFSFHEEWPKLTQGKINLRYEGRRLDASLAQGELAGISISDTTAWLPAIIKDQELRLELRAHGSGSLQQIKPFLRQTPLWHDLEREFNDIKLSGPMMLGVDLGIALDDKHDHLAVDGKVYPSDGKVELPVQHLDFTHLNGVIGFSETSISADNLTAQLWQQPVNFTIQPKKDTQGVNYTAFHGKGQFNAKEIEKHYPNPWWQMTTGDIDLDVTWNDYKHGAGVSNLIINSDLNGVALQLPEPLAKKAGQRWPLSAKLDFHEDGIRLLDLKLNKKMAGLLQWQSPESSEWQFQRGAIAIGQAKQEQLPDKPGLTVFGTVDKLDLQQWIDQTKTMWPKQAGSAHADVFQQAQLAIAQLKIGGQRYNDLNVSVKNQPNEWSVYVNSDALEGEINVPKDSTHAAEDFNFTLEKCRLVKSHDTVSAAEKVTVDTLPVFRGSCRQSQLWEARLGQVSVVTKAKDQSYQVEKLEINNPEFNVQANIDWQQSAGRDLSVLKGYMGFNNIAKVLAKFNLRSDIESREGKIDFDLQSKQPLPKVDFRGLQGDVKLQMREGRLVDVNAGVGRFISLFSFQNLQRRLRLDFSDVFKEGLAYDSLSGDFTLDNGVAYTSNTEFIGSSVYMSISGRTDLVNETLDLELEVIPNVTGTLPVAAAVATGNPAVGAAVWFFDKLLSSKAKKIASYRYHVSGPFNNPTIKRVSG